MGNLDELAARLIEQRVGLGTAFQRSGFAPVWPPRDRVPHQVNQQVLPKLTAPLAEAHDWLEARARCGVLIDPKVYAGLYFVGKGVSSWY